MAGQTHLILFAPRLSPSCALLGGQLTKRNKPLDPKTDAQPNKTTGSDPAKDPRIKEDYVADEDRSGRSQRTAQKNQ